jgi:hypothetical protein
MWKKYWLLLRFSTSRWGKTTANKTLLFCLKMKNIVKIILHIKKPLQNAEVV